MTYREKYIEETRKRYNGVDGLFTGGIECVCSTFGCPNILTPKEQLHGNKCTHCITKTSTPIDPTKFNGKL